MGTNSSLLCSSTLALLSPVGLISRGFQCQAASLQMFPSSGTCSLAGHVEPGYSQGESVAAWQLLLWGLKCLLFPAGFLTQAATAGGRCPSRTNWEKPKAAPSETQAFDSPLFRNPSTSFLGAWSQSVSVRAWSICGGFGRDWVTAGCRAEPGNHPLEGRYFKTHDVQPGFQTGREHDISHRL